MEVTGKIVHIGQTEAVGASGFRKRDVVVTTEEQYPQTISIQFVQDKCDMLNAYKIGDNVEVGVNLRGRGWVDPQGVTNYFNTIQGWKIKKLEEQAQQYYANLQGWKIEKEAPAQQEVPQADAPF